MSAPKSAPTERERLTRLIDDVLVRRVNFTEAPSGTDCLEVAEAILADGFHRVGAPRTPAPTEDSIAWLAGVTLIPEDTEIRVASLSYQKPSEFAPAALALLKKLAGRGEGET